MWSQLLPTGHLCALFVRTKITFVTDGTCVFNTMPTWYHFCNYVSEVKKTSKQVTINRYRIIYCCHGSDTLQTACEKRGLNADDVLAKLDGKEVAAGGAPDFANWPLDLLLDYVLKKHHRNFHLHHEELMQLVSKVASVHGVRHPELLDVRDAAAASFEELDSHFAKEENILFPQLYEMYRAQEENRPAAPCHCGTIANPIRQMMLEHDATDTRLRDTGRRLHLLSSHEPAAPSVLLRSQGAHLTGEQSHLSGIPANGATGRVIDNYRRRRLGTYP